MKVKDLVSHLQQWISDDPAVADMLLVQSRDAEGNGYSPVDEAATVKYLPESTWSGEVIHPDDADGYGDELQDVVCLWPVN